MERRAMNALETTILIAEDDDAHAELISANLVRAGLSNTIVRFRDGEELLAYLTGPELSSGSYLVLMDIRMPRMDGYEALQRMKASDRLRRIPVIMVTTTNDRSEIERCHDLGCSSYITKPVDYAKFVEAIRILGLFLAVVEVPVVENSAGIER